MGMPIGSDNMESLFGISKQHGTGRTKDANRMALRMPAICGELTREDARRVLDVSVREQQEVTASLPSLTKQRRDILPNPGSPDKIVTDGERRNLELIPRAKNRSNNLTNLNVTKDHTRLSSFFLLTEFIGYFQVEILCAHQQIQYVTFSKFENTIFASSF